MAQLGVEPEFVPFASTRKNTGIPRWQSWIFRADLAEPGQNADTGYMGKREAKGNRMVGGEGLEPPTFSV